MAGSIGTAYFNVAPNMSGVQGKVTSGLKGTGQAFAEQFGGEISGKSAVIVGAIAGIASAATSKALNILTSSIDSAVKRVDTLNSAQKTFQYMGFAAQDSSDAVKAVTKSIQGLPTPLDSAIRGMTGLAATYGDVKLGQKVFTGLNDAILGFGGSSAMVDNAIQQLSQLPMDGPLDAQTWNSLRNSGITPVLVAMSKDMGKSVSQLKEEFGNGTLKVSDFTNELIKLDTKGGGGLVSLNKIALNATSGIQTGFANMQTAVSRGMAKIIQAVGQKNISQAITAIGAGFENVLNIVAKSVPIIIADIKKFFDYVNKNKDIYYPIAVGIGAIVAALIAWKTALVIYTAATKAAAAIQVAFNAAMAVNPITLVILAIAGLVAGLAYFFTETKAGRKIFGEFTDFMSTAFKKIKPFIDGVSTVARLLFDTFTGGDPTIKASERSFSGVAKVLSRVSDAIRPLITFVEGQLSSAFKSITTIAKEFDAALKPVVSNLEKIANSIGKEFASTFKSIGEELKPVIASIENFVGILAKNKTVVKIFQDVGLAILALIAAPIISFIAGIVIGITVLAKILDFLAKHFEVVKAIAVAIFAPLILAVGIAIGAVKLIIATVKTLIDIFVVVFDIVKTVVKDAFNAIQIAWKSVLEPVFNFIISVVQTVFDIFIKVFAAIALVVLGTMSIIGGIIWNIMQSIWNVITSTWDIIYGVVSNVLSSITDVIVSSWNFFYGIISSVLGMIWNVITSVWNTVIGFLSGVFSTILGVVAPAWNRIYGTISGFVGNIWNSITGTFNNVIGFLSGIGGRILGALGNFGGLLYNAGRDLIQGLLNGAGSLLSSIGKFFLDKLPGWIQGPFRSALGIHSPSTVFAGFGANIAQGLANGVSNNAKTVTGAISDLADSAMNSFSTNGITADIAATAMPGSASGYATTQQTPPTAGAKTYYITATLGDQGAVKEFFKQLNQDSLSMGMGITPVQGAIG